MRSASCAPGAFSSNVPVRSIYSNFYNLAKSVMPRISETERAALECGTVGFDRSLFSGSPKLTELVKYDALLTPREQAFLDNETRELCAMLDDYSIQNDQDLPNNVWKFIREKLFFGMIIPESYGGLGFSAHAQSQIVQLIASRSGAAAVTVMVPNSLGPGELLLRYGTEAQRKHYLPRLADGRDLPCFALTGPSSGSDAAAMPDVGVVCQKGGVLGVRVTFNKRYITLAPVATVVGLAFRLEDPNKLLKGVGSEGITVALLPKGHPGLQIGARHDVLGIGFFNGTVVGKDVFIPMDFIIGGQERAGFGWTMLMESLAEGRGVSLPALATAQAKGTLDVVGAYARVRKQFKVPIAEMEGVQERLAEIARQAFTMTAAQHLMNGLLCAHERPSVLSAVMKQQMTERGRVCVNEGMDILGGAGICRGPNNLLATAYQGTPIAITVEGSNTLTRSLIIFGQGMVRSHPHLLNVMTSVRAGDDPKGFAKHVGKLVKHARTNAWNAVARAVTRNRFRAISTPVEYYSSQLERLAADFAIISDLSLTLGGSLKQREMVSGRLADALSSLYLGYACIWYYRKEYVPQLEYVLDFAMAHLLHDCQTALIGAADNFPLRPVGWVMRALTFPTGAAYHKPLDKLARTVSDLVTRDTLVRKLLTTNVFVGKSSGRAKELHDAMKASLAAEPVEKRLRKEKREPTKEETKILDEAARLRDIVIQVDVFPALGRALHEIEAAASSSSASSASLSPASSSSTAVPRTSQVPSSPQKSQNAKAVA